MKNNINMWKRSNCGTLMIQHTSNIDYIIKSILLELVWWAYNDNHNMKNNGYGANFRMCSRTNVSTSVRVFARGVCKECGKLTCMMSLVYLQGKWRCSCSPLMKYSSLSHNMTANIEVLCIPWPFVTWLVYTKSSIPNYKFLEFTNPPHELLGIPSHNIMVICIVT